MAFLIYKKTTGGKNVHYEKIKPLKFSGRDGLIARHVQTLSDAETQSWKLDAAALLKLAGITRPATRSRFCSISRPVTPRAFVFTNSCGFTAVAVPPPRNWRWIFPW